MSDLHGPSSHDPDMSQLILANATTASKELRPELPERTHPGCASKNLGPRLSKWPHPTTALGHRYTEFVAMPCR